MICINPENRLKGGKKLSFFFLIQRLGTSEEGNTQWNSRDHILTYYWWLKSLNWKIKTRIIKKKPQIQQLKSQNSTWTWTWTCQQHNTKTWKCLLHLNIFLHVMHDSSQSPVQVYSCRVNLNCFTLCFVFNLFVCFSWDLSKNLNFNFLTKKLILSDWSSL